MPVVNMDRQGAGFVPRGAFCALRRGMIHAVTSV
jgi:hypothetical protein